MKIFEYGYQEIEYLKSRDRRLGKAIDQIGRIKREMIPEPFVALVYSIVGQQISGKAAFTVWNRLTELSGGITPEKLEKLELSQIQSCGMSMRKAGYIKGITEAALSGTAHFQSLCQLPDAEILSLLTKLRGVGIWTAEMLLIFSLGRRDVVSFHDFGIRKGMMKLYHLNELKKKQFEELRMRYSPYGTTASLYLWEIAAGKE